MRKIGICPAWALACTAIAAAALLASGRAEAKGGTHPTSVSTWDASASTVAFSFQNAFLTPGGGHLRIASYHVNFSSTSGRLSSQFGVHYLNYAASDQADSTNGIGGTVIAQWAIPAVGRYENGLPKVSFNIFFGAAPAALINGQYNLVTIPLVLGLGLPMSPVKHISIVPWVEFAPSLNLDTKIKKFEGSLDDFGYDPENPDQINLSQQDVERILADSVEMETSFAAKLRGGLAFVVHLGDRADLQINGTVTRVGAKESNRTAIFVGGGLVIAWDKPVPAVLPVERRLENESCEAIASAYDQCYGAPKSEEKPAADGAVTTAPAAAPPAPADPGQAPVGSQPPAPAAPPTAPAPTEPPAPQPADPPAPTAP